MPIIVAIAAITTIGWWLVDGDLVAAIITGATVLIIACPCALGLATPRQLSLEREPRHKPVVNAHSKYGSTKSTSRDSVVESATAFERRPGLGIAATVAGRKIEVGNRRLMREARVDTTGLDARATELESLGRTVIWVGEVGQSARLLGIIALGDKVRPQSATTIRELQALGIQTFMLTGDNTRSANVIAKQLGMAEVIVEVLPDDKANVVAELKGTGKAVAKIGDGVNDAPALAAADVGFAMGSGSDIAMETAAVTLMRSDPMLIVDAISISKATYRKIRQNLLWAFLYNTAGVPLAAFGLFAPVMAGAAMALSSVSVVMNALLLKRWRPGEN